MGDGEWIISTQEEYVVHSTGQADPHGTDTDKIAHERIEFFLDTDFTDYADLKNIFTAHSLCRTAQRCLSFRPKTLRLRELCERYSFSLARSLQSLETAETAKIHHRHFILVSTV